MQERFECSIFILEFAIRHVIEVHLKKNHRRVSDFRYFMIHMEISKRIPSVIQIMIATFLPRLALCRMLRVCKTWSHNLQSKESRNCLWKLPISCITCSISLPRVLDESEMDLLDFEKFLVIEKDKFLLWGNDSDDDDMVWKVYGNGPWIKTWIQQCEIASMVVIGERVYFIKDEITGFVEMMNSDSLDVGRVPLGESDYRDLAVFNKCQLYIFLLSCYFIYNVETAYISNSHRLEYSPMEREHIDYPSYNVDKDFIYKTGEFGTLVYCKQTGSQIRFMKNIRGKAVLSHDLFYYFTTQTKEITCATKTGSFLFLFKVNSQKGWFRDIRVDEKEVVHLLNSENEIVLLHPIFKRTIKNIKDQGN